MKLRWKMRFATVIVGTLICAFVWHFLPLKAVFAVAQLSDPAKLATLGERGANSRLNKLVYWLDMAQHGWMTPTTVIDMAQTVNGTREPRATLVKDSLVRNLKIAGELGLLTTENLERLRHGKAATATRGPYTGESVEIDHIVPLSLAREVGNELANLEMLPKPLNRHKLAHVGPRQLEHAQKLFDAGLLTRESLSRVRAKANK